MYLYLGKNESNKWTSKICFVICIGVLCGSISHVCCHEDICEPWDSPECSVILSCNESYVIHSAKITFWNTTSDILCEYKYHCSGTNETVCCMSGANYCTITVNRTYTDDIQIHCPDLRDCTVPVYPIASAGPCDWRAYHGISVQYECIRDRASSTTTTNPVSKTTRSQVIKTTAVKPTRPVTTTHKVSSTTSTAVPTTRPYVTHPVTTTEFFSTTTPISVHTTQDNATSPATTPDTVSPTTSSPLHTTRANGDSKNDDDSKSGAVVAAVLIPIVVIIIICVVLFVIRKRRGYLCAKDSSDNTYEGKATPKTSEENSENGLLQKQNKDHNLPNSDGTATYVNTPNKSKAFNEEESKSKSNLKFPFNVLNAPKDKVMAFFKRGQPATNDVSRVVYDNVIQHSVESDKPFSGSSNVNLPTNAATAATDSQVCGNSLTQNASDDVNVVYIGDAYIEFQRGPIDNDHNGRKRHRSLESLKRHPPTRPPPVPWQQNDNLSPTPRIEAHSSSPNLLTLSQGDSIRARNDGYEVPIQSNNIVQPAPVYDYARVPTGLNYKRDNTLTKESAVDNYGYVDPDGHCSTQGEIHDYKNVTESGCPKSQFSMPKKQWRDKAESDDKSTAEYQEKCIPQYENTKTGGDYVAKSETSKVN